MVSFRFLVVTIVSIFLALGLGILAGTTVLDQTLVDSLKSSTKQAEHDAAKYKARLGRVTSFMTALLPRVVDGRLAHMQVLLVTDDNADGGAVSEARDYLTDANARIVAELRVRNTMAASNPASSGLGKLLAAQGGSTSGDLTEDAARALADRLQAGPPALLPNAGNLAHADLLDGLLNANYLDFPANSPPDPQVVGGPEQIVVVVAGGQSDPAVPFAEFMIPFVEELLVDNLRVAAAQPRDASHGFVGLLRTDGTIPDPHALVTVDNLGSDTTFGGVALVLGLKDLIRFGEGGDYGVTGADGMVPRLP